MYRYFFFLASFLLGLDIIDFFEGKLAENYKFSVIYQGVQKCLFNRKASKEGAKHSKIKNCI
jgi:hypothetical protein